MVGFLFGGTTGLSYNDLQERRAAADALARRIMGQQPKTTKEGIGALLTGAAAGLNRYQANKGMREGQQGATTLFDSIVSKMTGQPSNTGAFPAAPSGSQTGSQPNYSGSMMPKVNADGSTAVASSSPDVGNNGSTFSPFIDTVKTGIKTGDGNTLAITNPYGLAAVAATGKAESGWSPANANRSWSDPSESGQAGNAGGIMSWRAERLQGLQKYAASKGEQGNGSPQTQAEFFLQEDPQLVAKLNAAKSPEEAQSLMNNAWKFAGYDRPGGEAARRMSLANAYAPQFQGGTQVASLDPSAGMPPAAAAIDQQAPGSGYVDPMVSAPNFNPQAAGAAMPPTGRLPSVMDGPQQTAALGPQQAGAQLPPLPSRNVGSAPTVAAMPQQQPQRVVQNARASFQPQPYQIDPQILKFLANPFADEGQKQAVQLYLRQQMEQHEQSQQEASWRARQDYETNQRQSDPVYQANLEQTRVQTERLRDGTRPITADERKQWGIPEADTRPYAMTQNGPQLIGAGGQTINVGGQIEARKQAAEAMGLTKDDPRYMGYVLNGELPKESQQNLTAIDKKAIQDADDMVAANQSALDALSQAEGLSDKANSGWFAGTRASIGNNLPDFLVPDIISSPESSRATTDMDNAIIGQAVTQLKTIFGGNPTEGERNILLQLQGSSTMPADVRKTVFARARALAEKRLEFNQSRASDLRGGTYYKPDRAPATGTNVDDLLKKYGGQ